MYDEPTKPSLCYTLNDLASERCTNNTTVKRPPRDTLHGTHVGLGIAGDQLGNVRQGLLVGEGHALDDVFVPAELLLTLPRQRRPRPDRLRGEGGWGVARGITLTPSSFTRT
jgi:hypothetical protein